MGMEAPLLSLVRCGTKVWLDSIDPRLTLINRELGATGATSNPAIITSLIESGRFDDTIEKFRRQGKSPYDAAWELTDQLVMQAQEIFWPVWVETNGDDGYVSFELDPLLEDEDQALSYKERISAYVELGRKWSAGQQNRMIKVPATPAGLAALEELAASGVALNVTLIFTDRQYREARDAIWKGAQRRAGLEKFKSVYSVFVSRIDVYTMTNIPELSPRAQGLVGIVNAKRIWRENQRFWSEHASPLHQEIVFASTGAKMPGDDPLKYVTAFAGSDIETNPPLTNAAVAESGKSFTRQVDQMPSSEILAEIDAKVDVAKMEETLMTEGVKKFADPQKSLLELLTKKLSGDGGS